MKVRCSIVVWALAAPLWAACGGDDDPIDLGPDASGGENGEQICDPIEQSGCDEGEKCASRVESEDPLITATDCVPDGEASSGEACDLVGDPEDGEGYDDCEAGLTCSFGECTPICEAENGAACEGDDRLCVAVSDFFGDDIGLCAETCDPVEQDCEFEHAGGGEDGDGENGGENGEDGDGEFVGGCFQQPDREEGMCLNIAEEAEDRGQDDACVTGAGGQAFINGCAESHGCTYPLGQAMACAFYCEPTGDFDGEPCDVEGGPGADGYECRYLNGWYEFLFEEALAIPEDVGACIPTDIEGLEPCADDSAGPGCEPEFTGSAADIPGAERAPALAPQSLDRAR